MSAEIVYNAAVLRANQQYRRVVDYVLANASSLDDISRQLGLREAFLAAEAAGFQDDARRLALMLAMEDPKMPGIQRYLRQAP